MDYRTHLKSMMMKGKMYKLKGQGFVGINDAKIPKMQIGPYTGGTISHRVIVDRVEDSMKKMNVSGGSTRKKDYNIPKTGSGNFKSLKFNF